MMNKKLLRILDEQFNISDLDFSGDDMDADNNIFNKDLLVLKIYDMILNGEEVSEEDFDYLNSFTSAVKPEGINALLRIVNYYSNADNYEQQLNWIDVSDITDMSRLFFDSMYNGDISKWDVSNVTNMSYMFAFSYCYDIDVSGWDVSNVTDMSYMFANSEINIDVTDWDVSNVTDMSYMFKCSEFNFDISHWDVSNVLKYDGIFMQCTIRDKYKPKKFR